MSERSTVKDLLQAILTADESLGSMDRGQEKDLELKTSKGYVKLNIQWCEPRKLIQKVEIELEYEEGQFDDDYMSEYDIDGSLRWIGDGAVTITVTEACTPEPKED